jgi:SAM-dependent methyltransferase
VRPSAWLFHKLSVKDYTYEPGAGVRDPAWYEAGAQRFLDRFEGRVDFRGKTVLDVGCGTGSSCGLAAQLGATRVVGVDLYLMEWGDERLREAYGEEAASRVELKVTTGDLHELGGEQFDIVLSKESFEHYADPEAFIHVLARRVRPGGELVIGFGPLWKAFDGGHVSYVSKVPWAHLLFPEEVVLAERGRFRPDDPPATDFTQVGVNKMTLRRFHRIMTSSGLRPEFLVTNAGEHPAVKVMRQVARLRPVREYFTNNVYGIWRKPATS